MSKIKGIKKNIGKILVCLATFMGCQILPINTNCVQAMNMYEGNSISEGLLSEPMLQNPGDNYVRVVWFTETEGKNNNVILYENGSDKQATKSFRAVTTKMSRLRGGKTEGDCNKASISRDIYRHEATVLGLPKYTGSAKQKVEYQVQTDSSRSRIYTLNAKAQPGTAQKILLTSDLQIKDMCAANFQKVYETVGNVDAIWCDGDLVDVCDRAYDWFYADNAFFRVLQGTANDKVGASKYYGAPLLQYAPIYTAIGNHDVMGRFNSKDPLNDQFNNPSLRAYAEAEYEFNHINDDPNMLDPKDKEEEIINNSFNTITYDEMFSLPKNSQGIDHYYAVTIGDVRLVSLEVARVWRLSQVGVRGKYSELPAASPKDYGFGDFIFEPITPGSNQYKFLTDELSGKDYKDAKYKVVMFHNDYHSLGGNQIPPYTDPVASVVKDPVTGYDMTIYDYPIEEDHLAKYVEPLLKQNKVNLLFNAHSHVWNRFKTDYGMNILQTSNVGNSYNCYYGEEVARPDIPSVFKKGDARASLKDNWNAANYVLSNDPYGLEPVKATKTELPSGENFIGDNSITVFSILDTADGKVRSYYYDTKVPGSDVVLFDEFNL